MPSRSPRLKTLLAAAAISLAAIPAGYAQTRPGADCGRDRQACLQQQGKPQTRNAAASAPQKAAHAAPRAGDSARAGKPFQRAAASRFKAPPRGQEYRVVGDHLVLADQKTLQVITVLGLVSALTGN